MTTREYDKREALRALVLASMARRASVERRRAWVRRYGLTVVATASLLACGAFALWSLYVSGL